MSVKPLALLRAATKVAAMLAMSVSYPALAANINKQVPAELILGFCADKPANSETRASFTGTDGSIITGTVECDPEDLAELAGNDTSATPGDDDGTPDQGGGNDDDSDDDLNDDHGGDDDSSDDGEDDSSDDSSDDSDDDSSDDSDDDSSDDHSGHGGGDD